MSDKKKILIIQPIHKAGIDLKKNNPNYDYEIIENLDDKDIKQKILECDGLSIRSANLSSELINISKKLKIISRHGVGYDNIDLKSSKEKKSFYQHKKLEMLNYIKDSLERKIASVTASIEAVSYTHLTLPTKRIV